MLVGGQGERVVLRCVKSKKKTAAGFGLETLSDRSPGIGNELGNLLTSFLVIAERETN